MNRQLGVHKALSLVGILIGIGMFACNQSEEQTQTARILYRALQTPCGKTLVETGSREDVDYAFTGYERDNTLHLLDAGARMFDSTTCQFTGTDPIDHPQMSSYAYAANNPMNNVDPDGRQTVGSAEYIAIGKALYDADSIWDIFLPPSQVIYARAARAGIDAQRYSRAELLAMISYYGFEVRGITTYEHIVMGTAAALTAIPLFLKPRADRAEIMANINRSMLPTDGRPPLPHTQRTGSGIVNSAFNVSRRPSPQEIALLRASEAQGRELGAVVFQDGTTIPVIGTRDQIFLSSPAVLAGC